MAQKGVHGEQACMYPFETTAAKASVTCWNPLLAQVTTLIRACINMSKIMLLVLETNHRDSEYLAHRHPPGFVLLGWVKLVLKVSRECYCQQHMINTFISLVVKLTSIN